MIQSYYIRFSKLINDINIIGLHVKKLRINIKFVNHLQPEWSRFITRVKQARNLHELVKGSKKAAEGSSKKAAGKLEQKDAKRQRIEEENESAELKRFLEIIPDDGDNVTIGSYTPIF
nr:hypothetical protein [Tanacetum cinerariifolium]